jgi:pimeloyl-ACP methyl ester carboxylesterase
MRTIILLHGAIGSGDQLEPLKKELTALGYTTYSFNFSGHGQTAFNNDFGIKQFSTELEQFIDKQQLKRPDIFGYSMGGYVALYLASQKKDLLGNIITLGTKFDWDPGIAQKEIKMLDPDVIREKVPKFAAALQVRHGKDWEELLRRTQEMMIELGNNNLLNTTTFSQIDNCVLIGLADGDTMVTKEETDHAASQIKNARRYTLQNTKHPIETVNVTGLIKNFGRVRI